jgi:hypothetical protein
MVTVCRFLYDQVPAFTQSCEDSDSDSCTPKKQGHWLRRGVAIEELVWLPDQNSTAGPNDITQTDLI